MIPTNYFKVWVPGKEGRNGKHFFFPFTLAGAKEAERAALTCRDLTGCFMSTWRPYRIWDTVGIQVRGFKDATTKGV